MTEPDQQPDMPAALRLSVAIDQLIQPGVAHLDRSQPENTPEVAAIADELERDYRQRRDRLEAQYLAARDRLRARHKDYLARRDRAGMRRAMDAIAHLDQERRAAESARNAPSATLPSLLDQLHDAVESSQGTGSGSAGVSRSPIGLNAAELLGHIQRAVAWRGTGQLADRLRAWAYDPARTDDDAQAAEQWVDDARAVVQPDRGFELGGACPLCGTRYVWVQDGDERTRKAALQVSYASRSARCIAPGCTGRWPKEYLEHLARVVVQDRSEKAG